MNTTLPVSLVAARTAAQKMHARHIEYAVTITCAQYAGLERQKYDRGMLAEMEKAVDILDSLIRLRYDLWQIDGGG